MWAILKVLYLVRAVSTHWKSELFNRQDFFCVAIVPLFFSLFFSFFSLFFLCYSQKNRWQLFVFVGDAALKVPTSLKRRIQNLQDFSLNKKPHSWKRCCCFSTRQTQAKADHQWRCSLYTGEVDKGPFRVVQDGWEHAKLSPLSPRTEIFPGSQNSKPTGEALSEYDAEGAELWPYMELWRFLSGSGAPLYGYSPIVQQPENTHSLHFSSCLGPYMWWVWFF